MSTVKVTDIIRRVEDVLQDTNIRWPRTELQNWMNESYLAITLARPDANAKTGSFTCATGTRQVLSSEFPSSLRLLDVTRNLATNSGYKVIRLVARSVLDDQRPAWHAETGTTAIQHFTFDPRQPKEFFVYPPATTAAEIEVVYTDSPGATTLTESQLDPAGSDATVILLDDIYMSPMIDWILYRAYSKDAEYGANEQRAQAAYGAFNAALATKNQVDSAVSPSNMSSVT
ncbi:hypothetical protein N9F51_00340 [bacterium]|jgi:hypothetical protein|nr:hypothetical protein [bacterium]